MAEDALDYEWGYEWPTAEQWAAGQTYGRCWAPDTSQSDDAGRRHVTTFVTASVCVLRDGALLTVRKRGTSRFMLPGGKLEPGETPVECAVREAAEEIGLVLAAEELVELGDWTSAGGQRAGRAGAVDRVPRPAGSTGAADARRDRGAALAAARASAPTTWRRCWSSTSCRHWRSAGADDCGGV